MIIKNKHKHYMAMAVFIFGLTFLFGAGMFLGYQMSYNAIPSALDNYKILVTNQPWDALPYGTIEKTYPIGTLQYKYFYWLEPIFALISIIIIDKSARYMWWYKWQK